MCLVMLYNSGIAFGRILRNLQLKNSAHKMGNCAPQTAFTSQFVCLSQIRKIPNSVK